MSLSLATRPTRRSFTLLAINRASPQLDGLIHWWPGMNGTGDIVDVIGGLDGTISGNADRTTDGRMGHIVDYPGGAGDYVEIGDTATVDFGSGDFALGVWAKLNGMTNGNQIYISKDDNNQRQIEFQFDKDDDNGNIIRFGYYKGGNSAVVLDTTSPSNPIKDTDWHHLFGQRVGDDLEIYVDGVLAAGPGITVGTAGSMRASNAPLQLGRREFSGFNNEFNGQLFEHRIYGKSFSSSGVRLFVEPRTRFELSRRPLRRSIFLVEVPAAPTGGPPLYMHHFKQMANNRC